MQSRNMLSLSRCRYSASYIRPIPQLQSRRLATPPSSPASEPESANSSSSPNESTPKPNPPLTHFKITLTRSGIALGKKVQGTLLALGFHRRFQTVYFPHSPEVAGKILRVKELVRVENVSEDMVMNAREQRQARKPSRGYTVVGTRKGSFMGI